MEHIIITPISGDYVRLTPEQGYRLRSISVNRFVSEAVVRQDRTSGFEAVPIPVVSTPKRTRKK